MQKLVKKSYITISCTVYLKFKPHDLIISDAIFLQFSIIYFLNVNLENFKFIFLSKELNYPKIKYCPITDRSLTK